MKVKKILALGISLGIFITGCGSERPFSAKYTSPNQVIITYKGKQYTLNRFGTTASVPFEYEFENDGDLDLTIDGKRYEVDSPYDRDNDKKKVVKKSAKKTVKKKNTTRKNGSYR